MSKASTTTPAFSTPSAGIKAKDIACFVGKLFGGCLTLIAVAYFWALVKDSTPEIDGWFFSIFPILSVLSLAFYLAVTAAMSFGIKAPISIAKAAPIVCIAGPWICLVPIFAYLVFELTRGAGHEETAAIVLAATAITALAITRRWAKKKPYLTGNLLLLSGVFCMLIGAIGALAVGLIFTLFAFALVLVFFLIFGRAIYRAM